ncbi:hypothetical protein [Pseudomonas sp.]|uniref:hypothetical protein n=1 Tax=Pseudomonas sp. TaxID=306 RepID=UPI0019B77305|nr:hypothetical protein [Pseudomonas sp.]MBC6626281.1 hypothetical protein [Pseudomonas sp.]
MPKKIFRKKVPRKRTIVRKALRSANRKVFNRKVRSVITTMAEKHEARFGYMKTDVAGIGYYNSVSWGVDDGLFVISPLQSRLAIVQGDAQNSRQGNRIRTQSSWLNGVLTVQPYNAAYNPNPRPIDCLVYIYKVRGGGNSVQSTLAGFYQNNATTTAPQTSLYDTVFPINTDTYQVVWRRMFKLGAAANPGTGIDNNNQRWESNDYKRTCRFRVNLTKFYDKVWRYDDNTPTPTNNILYLAILPINSDNTIPASGNGLRPVGFVMNQTFRYLDI